MDMGNYSQTMKTMLTSLLSALKSNYVTINPLLKGRDDNKKNSICKNNE